MKGMDPQVRLIFTFTLAFTALLMLVLASQVGMPLRAIMLAVAVSDVIFLLLIGFGDRLPGKRRD